MIKRAFVIYAFFNFNFSSNPSLLYFIKITVVDLKTKGKQKNNVSLL